MTAPHDPSKDSEYPSFLKLVATYFSEDWFYIHSPMLGGKSNEHFYMNINKPDEPKVLLEMVIDLICEDHKENKELMKRSIEDIDRIIANTVEDDTQYIDTFIFKLHMPNLPLDTWQEHKQFLLHFKEKLQATLLENPL